MKRIWIIGAGKFGRRAAFLLSHGAGREVIVVDKKKERLEGLNTTTIIQDGVDCLVENVNKSDTNNWIVPAVPFQLAYEWVGRKLAPGFSLVPVKIVPEWEQALPNCILGFPGQAFVSNADFLCPDDCPEPKGYCSHTGLPRPRIMHRFLADWGQKYFDTTVIRSRQLAPGLGGYPAHDMFAALERICTEAGFGNRFLLATACSCHGVLNVFEVRVLSAHSLTGLSTDSRRRSVKNPG